MWTVDARCPRCAHKKECLDREILITKSSALTSELNAPPYSEGIGDGIIVLACHDFAVGS